MPLDIEAVFDVGELMIFRGEFLFRGVVEFLEFEGEVFDLDILDVELIVGMFELSFLFGQFVLQFGDVFLMFGELESVSFAVIESSFLFAEEIVLCVDEIVLCVGEFFFSFLLLEFVVFGKFGFLLLEVGHEFGDLLFQLLNMFEVVADSTGFGLVGFGDGAVVLEVGVGFLHPG